MDNPIEDSVADNAKMNNTKICPVISSRYKEKVIKLTLTDNNKSSSDIIVFNIFPLFKTNPSIPIWNNNIERLKR